MAVLTPQPLARNATIASPRDETLASSLGGMQQQADPVVAEGMPQPKASPMYTRVPQGVAGQPDQLVSAAPLPPKALKKETAKKSPNCFTLCFAWMASICCKAPMQEPVVKPQQEAPKARLSLKLTPDSTPPASVAPVPVLAEAAGLVVSVGTSTTGPSGPEAQPLLVEQESRTASKESETNSDSTVP